MNHTLNAANLLTWDNPAFCCYLFWCSVLILKMLFMSLLAATQRFRTKSFSNPEDLKYGGIEVEHSNEDVERVRRAHRNDLENILPFLIIALPYLALKPDLKTTCWLFRIGSIARLVHTMVYAFRPVPQPARSFSFFVHFSITFYMAFYVLACTLYYV